MAWDGISLLRYLLEKSCGRHHIASNVIKNKRGRTIQIFSGKSLKTLLSSSPVLQGQKRGQFAFRWKTGHDQVDNFLTWTNLKRQLGNALWVYPHLITTIAPPSPLSKETIVSEQNIWKIIFTFDIYLGTSWKEAPAAKEPIQILTGWWKDVLQIFGTSWMLCGSLVLVNGNIWEIFAQWRGQLLKKLFWSLLKSRVWLASVQNFNFNSHALHVFRQ